MEDSGVSDTIAYRIVDQILSHIYPDEEMSDGEFIKIYKAYINAGGSWESLVRGDSESFGLIMDVLKAFVKIRKKPKKYGI